MKVTSYILAMCVMTAVLAIGPTTWVGASVILFDNSLAAGWSGTWRMSAESSNVYSGTGALSSSNGQFELSTTGLIVGDNYWLEAWVNTAGATASNVEVFLSYAGQTNIPFDNRNVPTTYCLNGVEIISGKTGILTDDNLSTWQLLRINLTQTAYTGWPYISHTFDPQTDQLLTVRFVGSNQLLLDEVRLIPQSEAMAHAVPEPAMMSLLGIGVLSLRMSRKRG